jgi:hypothetical protein
MSRNANETRLAEAQRMLTHVQGEKARQYARRMDIHPYDFNTLLAMLNERGFFLWEDDDGRLWVCEPQQD